MRKPILVLLLVFVSSLGWGQEIAAVKWYKLSHSNPERVIEFCNGFIIGYIYFLSTVIERSGEHGLPNFEEAVATFDPIGYSLKNDIDRFYQDPTNAGIPRIEAAGKCLEYEISKTGTGKRFLEIVHGINWRKELRIPTKQK